MKIKIIFSTIFLLVVCGCKKAERQFPKTNAQIKHEGVMNDYSYAGQITEIKATTRINALHQNVIITDFNGKFVWATYAAPWCKACRFQAPIIKRIEKSFKTNTVFITILTSKSMRYEDIPSIETAKDWAEENKLDPKKTLAATNLWSITIPRHILYSPEGQTLFWHTGFLEEKKIRNIISSRIMEWKKWKKDKTTAKWMRLRK
ncbi:MAG: hypothetical protein KAI43_02915 [Candidatus Aureabacteria bacterium]|nr:hypothetical protein [Candidatus Auribacterota bacterium]